MARAYGTLSRENWTEASLHELIVQELRPVGDGQFAIHGNDVRLKPQQALSVTMALHELATNAAKYGSLSSSEGKVDVACSITDNCLSIDWQERGGPTPSNTDKKGFGSELLQGEIGYRLEGKLETNLTPAGLDVHIEFPLR